MTLRWPDTLPLPMVDNYEVQHGEGVLRTDMESGPARQRLEFTQVPNRIPVKWKLTESEYGVYEAWRLYKGRLGAEWFTIPLRCGLGLVDHGVRFASKHRAPYEVGGRWYVITELEVRDPPVMSEAALNILLDTSLPNLIAAVDALHVLANTTLHNRMGV